MDSPALSQASESEERWSTVCGNIQKEQIIYSGQIVIIGAVIIACLINLSLEGSQHALWASLLSGSVGYVLPAPKIRKKKKCHTFT